MAKNDFFPNAPTVWFLVLLSRSSLGRYDPTFGTITKMSSNSNDSLRSLEAQPSESELIASVKGADFRDNFLTFASGLSVGLFVFLTIRMYLVG